MSQAHRPTWNPAQGRETKAGSQQISKLSLAAHTKLKFRQPGQTNTSDVARRDLKAELLAAERASLEKKRKAEGLPPLAPLGSQQDGQLRIEGARDGEEDEAAAKRRKILEEAAEMDKDDESESDEGEEEGKGKGKAVDDEDEDDDDDDSDDDSDDEDDTAALMAELAKIKQERAEEKARLDAEAASSEAISREAEIATGNPLMNLQAALGTASDTPRSTTSSASTFAVKRRWDDDLIFKNQAVGIDDKPKRGEFVNDLLRSEFHKKFMNRFIK
ncbi:conserved hypothetical protein [Cryptococcus deneoformans JEC21]|uniref:Protein CWC15 n=1 Tax=Cryptococcus deneoformans (strain JEC21 / ATCC MYA-565) TaxID=214684 RepID=Q5K7B3_CRYD1|nr:conserved hypothetical protein [Cryptococcus neoformans var. neoformans JEC21]AAW47057.2 conserved hypothetical protein [Cryptococcus neoformans var. neoformans JEC21]